MADFHVIHWAEEHPAYAGAIVFVGGLALLWFLGYLGPSSSSSNQANNQQQQAAITEQQLATAYYAAEAAQSTAGTELQLAQVNDQAAVNIAGGQNQAAVAINAANNTTQQLGYTTAGGLGTTQANDALAASENANQYSAAVAQTYANAANYNTLFNTTIPYELALTGGAPTYGNFAGTSYGLTTGGMPLTYAAPIYPGVITGQGISTYV